MTTTYDDIGERETPRVFKLLFKKTITNADALADRIYDYVWARTTAEPTWMAA